MKICLAPMDWITDCAYRIICKQIFEKHGHPDDELMLRTEFMSADGYCHNPPGVIKHLLRSDYDHETIMQIFGGNAESLVQCALDIEQKYDFAGIELNMWCPSPKIMKCAAWSGMLKDKKKTLSILKEIRERIRTPFSLKTRTGLSKDDVEEQFNFLIEASTYVRMIGVHGRTYKQSHAWYVDRDFINKLKERLPNTVIIWNGGIRSYQQALEQYNKGCDGIMIAQSAIGNPRILTPHTPTIQERYDTIISHLKLSLACEIYFRDTIQTYNHKTWLIQPSYEILEHISNTIDSYLSKKSENERPYKAPIEFRKFLFSYISWLPESKKIKKIIPQAREYTDLKSILDEYFHHLLSLD